MIKADSPGIGKLARDLARVAIDAPKTFAQATASVARASKTEAKREIAAIYALPQRRIDQGLAVSTKGYEVSTTAKSKGVSLQSFGGRWLPKRGYAATIRKGRRIVIAGGFTPAKFSGLPFKRVGPQRMPIKVLYGPSVAAMFRNREVAERFILRQSIRARDELTRRLLRELKR